MLRRIQALNYRCLRHVDVELDRFHVLVGPNGSGKSAFFDAIAFASEVLSGRLHDAVDARTKNFQDLVWSRPKDDLWFEIALEFEAPDSSADDRPSREIDSPLLRYELAVCETDGDIRIAAENLEVAGQHAGTSISPRSPDAVPNSILSHGPSPFAPKRARERWFDHIGENSLRWGLHTTLLDNRLAHTLTKDCRLIFLDSRRLRSPSPPMAIRRPLEPDGSNLPWAVRRLSKSDSGQFNRWLGHVRTAVPDIDSVRVVERGEDRHAYLMIRYPNGVEVPSWGVSDGTLRLLALTLMAYLPESGNVYLLEEPENGMHPLAVETVYQSLSSVHGSQVLAATHSPVFLRCAELGEILCFSKTEDGATQVIPADHRLTMTEWRSLSGTDLLFASPALG